MHLRSLSYVNQWWSELSQLDLSTFRRIVNAPLIICIAMHFRSTPFCKVHSCADARTKTAGCQMQILFSAQKQVFSKHAVDVLPFETENRMYELMCDISSWAALSRPPRPHPPPPPHPFGSLFIPLPRAILFELFQLSFPHPYKLCLLMYSVKDLLLLT